MLERLLENWLDNASEKSYQSPLCQMLSAKGHTILHSTRHSNIEFGKDILTLDDKNTPCAFQLKGNPGSRLTLAQFREIESQLIQLVYQPIIYPGLDIKHHKTFLVTNGYVEEEVQRAIDDLNRGFSVTGAIGSSISLINRGQLLDWAKELGSNLWPSELVDINRLLNILVTEGDEQFPVSIFHDLLSKILILSEDRKNKPSADEIKRRITSAAILTSTCLKNFSEKNNQFATIISWVIYCAYVISVCEKYNLNYDETAKRAVDIASEAIFVSLSDLCDDLREREHFVEGHPLVDFFVYKARFTLLVSLMCVYWFWCEEREWPKDFQRNFLNKLIPDNIVGFDIWGEGVIPQILIFIWRLRSLDSTLKPDILLAIVLNIIVKIATNKDGNGLPSPYYNFEDVMRHNFRGFLLSKKDPIGDDSFKGTSFFANPLMHLLVRTNLKQKCKEIWSDLSKLNFKQFDPSTTWEYCLWRAQNGREIVSQPPFTKEWSELVNEARDISCAGVPTALKLNKFLLMLFVIIFPHRCIPSVVRYLGRQFNNCWFIPPPIEK